MKKLLLIGAALAIAGPAMAADQAVRVYRRPVVVAAPVYSWTGFYIGGNVGYSWGDARTDVAGSGSTTVFGGIFPTFPGFISSVAFADSNTARLKGVVGGGQVGYNYQFNRNWVLGFEADIQGSGQRGSVTFIDPFTTTICLGLVNGNCVNTPPLNGNGTAVTGYEAKIGWFGTVRGRLGVLIADQVLLYGTGGLTYGQIELSGNTNVSGSVSRLGVALPFTGGTAFSASKTNVGFSVGGGIEGKFSLWLPANWTWKLEYLYLDLGSLDAVTSFASVLPIILEASPLTGPIATHTRFTDNIVRVGLNYKFGNYYAPVVTK